LTEEEISVVKWDDGLEVYNPVKMCRTLVRVGQAGITVLYGYSEFNYWRSVE